MRVTDAFRILRARWLIVAAVTALALVGAGLLLPDRFPQGDDQQGARATSTLVLEDTSTGGGKGGGPTQLSNLVAVASQGTVPARVAEELGTTVPALNAQVKVTTSKVAASLSIAARDRTRDRAAEIAETYSRQLLALLTAEARASQDAVRASLAEQVGQLEAQRAQLDAKVKTEPAAKAELDGVARQLTAQRAKLTTLSGAPLASAPLRSLGPPTVVGLTPGRSADRLLQLPVRLSLAGVLGFAGSLAALMAADRFDLRVRTKQAAELAYALPVVAEVPALPRKLGGTIAVVSDPQSAYAESHRILRTALEDKKGHEGGGGRLVVVTSADPQEGKTATAANLAASFAEAGRDTLLVELDLRSSDLSDMVQSSQPPDEIVLPPRPHEPPIRIAVRDSGMRDLRLVTLLPPFGPPAVILPRVASWLRGLQEVDMIVVDTPPLLLRNDASEVIPFADTVVVACRAGVTTAEAAERAAELLVRLQAPVAGVVLIGADLRAPGRKVSQYRVRGWTPATDGGGLNDDPTRGLSPADPTVLPSWAGEVIRGDPPITVKEDPPVTPVAEPATQSVPTAMHQLGLRPTSAPDPAARPPPDPRWRQEAVPVAPGPTAARRTVDRVISFVTFLRGRS